MRILQENKPSGFSLAEAIIGIGMATVLVLSIIAMTTAALSGDQKAEMRQVALALADSELNRFVKVVGVANSAERTHFWRSTDGPYSGPGTRSTVKTNRTEFKLEYKAVAVDITGGSSPIRSEELTEEPLPSDSDPDNRLRKLDLTVSWWNGENGKPGYGQLSVTSTRLVRESDIREKP